MDRMKAPLTTLGASCAVALAVSACGGATSAAEPAPQPDAAAPSDTGSTPATNDEVAPQVPAAEAEHEDDAHQGTDEHDPAASEAQEAPAKKTKKKRRVAVALGAPNEFDLVPAKPRVKAGNVTFKLNNTGTIEHELIVIRTDLDSGALPTDADGAAIEDGAVAPNNPGRTDAEHEAHVGTHVAAGKKATVTLRLKRGNYALVCNLPGHYAAGMHANFKVVR